MSFETGAPEGTELPFRFKKALDREGNFYRDNLRAALAEMGYICDGKRALLPARLHLFQLSLCAEYFRNIFDRMLTCALALIRLTSVVQCGIIILEEIRHRESATQAKVAESVGTNTPYVSRSVNGGDKVVNEAFISMMVDVGWRRMI